MKTFIASLIVVLTMGTGSALAECGWIVWQIMNKDEKNFWRIQDGVQTYDECKVSAETLVESFFATASANDKNHQVLKNEWAIIIIRESKIEESTQLESTNVEFLCLPTSMDPRT